MRLQVSPCAQSVAFPKVLIQHELLQALSGTSQFQLEANEIKNETNYRNIDCNIGTNKYSTSIKFCLATEKLETLRTRLEDN